MPADSLGLIEALAAARLLEESQANQAKSMLASSTPQDTANSLIDRGWITPYQAEQVLLGNAAELILGPYILLDQLGEGGMGQVFKARHLMLKSLRAIKVIRPDRLGGDNAVDRFYREMEAVAKLHHPNIIHAYDANQENGRVYFVMEYAKGKDLGRVLMDCCPLPVGRVCDWIRQAALGLQHAHQRGLVHRDLKPSNLLLTDDDWVVKVLDLGLARVRAGEDPVSNPALPSLTQDGAVMGTPDYMSPEQADDSHSVDIRADIYSLGCTMYHLLTGRPPFAGGSLMDKLIRHRTEEPQPATRLRGDLPAGLAAVLARSLVKDREQRYQIPADFAAALAPFAQPGAPPRPAEQPSAPIQPGATPGRGLRRASTLSAQVIDETTSQFSPSAAPTTDHLIPGQPRQPAGSRTDVYHSQSPSAAPAATPSASLGSSLPPLPAASYPEPTAVPEVPAKPDRPKARLPWVAGLAVALVAVAAVAGVRFLSPPAVEPDDNSHANNGTSNGGTPLPPKDEKKDPPDKDPIVKPTPDRGPGPAWTRDAAGDMGSAAEAKPAAGLAFAWPNPLGKRRDPRYAFGAGTVRQATLSADGKVAAVLGPTETLTVYELLHDLPGSRLQEHKPTVAPLDQLSDKRTARDALVRAVALSPDGKRVVLATAGTSPVPLDGTNINTVFNLFIAWDRPQGTPIYIYGSKTSRGTGEFGSLALGPGGRDLLAGNVGFDGTAYRWKDFESSKKAEYLGRVNADTTTAVAYSGDGQTLIVGGRSGEVSVYNARKKPAALRCTLKAHTSPITAVALSEEGDWALTASADKKVHLWQVPAEPKPGHKPEREVKGHTKTVTSLAFAPRGGIFLTGGEDGVLVLGNLTRPDPVWTEQPDLNGEEPAPIRAVAFTSDGEYAVYATERSVGRYLVQPILPAAAQPCPSAAEAGTSKGPGLRR